MKRLLTNLHGGDGPLDYAVSQSVPMLSYVLPPRAKTGDLIQARVDRLSQPGAHVEVASSVRDRAEGRFRATNMPPETPFTNLREALRHLYGYEPGALRFDTFNTALRGTIRNLYGCEATWIDSVRIRQRSAQDSAWEGNVQVFRLHGHATAKWCYAWSWSPDSDARRFVAILRQPPVDSAESAVRAAHLKP